MYTRDELLKRRAALSDEQRSLLKKRMQREASATEGITIPRRPSDEAIPLSFAQQRLWFLQQFDPESTAYNETITVSLKGQFDYTALTAAFKTMVQRHEVLRTLFPLNNGQALQHILSLEKLDITIPIIDLQILPAAERDCAARSWVEEEMQRPFQLTDQLPWRAHLLQLDRSVYVLHITMHHIVTDAWSLEIFLKEVIAHYQAHCQGQPAPLPELSIQYADYACWLRQWLASDELGRQIHYWEQRLADPPPMLELPLDRPRPALLSHHGERVAWKMPRALYQALYQLSRQEGATLFMALLAALNVLLYRYTMQEDALIGSPVAGRIKPELEPLLGCFVNTLVFRTDLSGGPDFREVLRRVRTVALEAYEHQDVPYEKLVEVLQPERNTSHNPFFQVMFVLQNVPQTNTMPSELHIQPFETTIKTTRFDLSMILRETIEGIDGYVEFNTDLFESTTIERFLTHYQTLLESIVTYPDKWITNLPILPSEEWLHVVQGSNVTPPGASSQLNMHQIFEQQVKRAPNAIAVSDERESLSYSELNKRAEMLAAHLQPHINRPETIVGLCMERSVTWAVAVLAIMKAGAVYLPLDPQYPPARLQTMLEQSHCHCLLTSQDLLESLSIALAALSTELLCLEDLLIMPQPETHRASHVFYEKQLAYIIFTSGSTGLPKGAMVDYQGLLNHLQGKIAALLLKEQDIVAQTASQCFDISVWQLLAPWLVGARVQIYPDQIVADPATLLQRIEQDGISILEGVPSWLRVLLDTQLQRSSAERPALQRLRLVIPTGEALPVHLCQQWLHHYPHIPLLNAYGPTECSDDVTHQLIDAQTDLAIWGETAPIGKPLSGLYLYILDPYGQPQPIGIWGELYIGGIGVGRGYLGNPARTAQAFVPDPYGNRPGGRLYRTGDVGRYRADGSIEFRGRIDLQVKLRGYRIELGDIESALHLHPALGQCVVLLREDMPGNKRLVAYVTLRNDQYVASEELWRFLQKRLPDYMLPSTFMYVDSLPLLSNGKVNRQALPAPDASRPRLDVEFVAARDPITELLTGIWSQILLIDQIGLHDNFFSLGGHSLLVPQLAAGIQRTFGIELSWPTFFISPTIAELALTIKQALQQELAVTVPALVPVSREQELPLSFTQERLLFLDQLNPEQHLYNVFGGIRLYGTLSITALEQSLQAMVHRHEMLRTTFRIKTSGSFQQVIEPALAIALPIIDLSDLSEIEQELAVLQLVEQEKTWSFDLSLGPLLRATVVRLAEKEHIFLLASHVILLDGWATEILLRELALLYKAEIEQAPAPLADLPLQYADYACWQHALLQNERLEPLLAYWKQQLANLPVLTLTTDRPRPARPSFQAATLPVHLPAELVCKLRALSQKEGATLYMTLLAAYQSVLARYSGQDDIVVGSPIANRSSTQLEGVLGSFINTLVLRTDLSGNPTFSELLRRVCQTSLHAYAHQDLPFEKLLAELHPERDMSRNPLFQTLFAFQNIPQVQIHLPGLSTEFLPDAGDSTVFDLDLTMWEEGDWLEGSLKYSTDLFDEPLVTRIKDDFFALLELVVTYPEQRIADMILSPQDAQRQLLVEWNATETPYSRDLCIQDLFEAQVRRTPDAIAVVFDQQRLTYQQLNQQANALARLLRSLDIGPGSMVAVLMERGLEMIPAVLGILKAGASYVPLEIRFPAARIEGILHTLDIRVLLTQSTHLPLVQKIAWPLASQHIICLDVAATTGERNNSCAQRVWTQEDLAQQASENLPKCITPDALAYVIFTSGSTGTPKGVMVRHQPVVNLIEWVNKTFQIGQADRILFITSLCFDLSVYDIFGLLAAGGSIQIASESDLREPERLLGLLCHEPVTFWDSAPAALQQLVPFFSAMHSHTIQSSLRLVFLSGDWIPVKLPDQVRTAFPAAEVVSLGGATEATVWSNFFRIREVDPHWPSIPYGKPIQNAGYYILDRYLNPCPIGVPGDLYIGGECLAEGYIGEAKLTAQKFIPHPFSQRPGSRLYRTGDVARFWSDGTMEFLGRSDSQVKIRGFRIELGEIETTLSKHPGIQIALVEARPDTSGEKRLVGYVVPEQGEELTTEALWTFLRGYLPEYMLPSAFVFLDSLPITSNGKVDRQRLPAVDLQTNLEKKETYIGPTNTEEEKMAAVWIDVLKLPRVSIHDNFFALGGHSLLAVQLIAQVRATWLIHVPLRELFEFSTVAELTARVVERLEHSVVSAVKNVSN